MRSLIIVLALVASALTACEQAVPPPLLPSAAPSAVACAPRIVAGAPLDVRLTTLEGSVGSLVIFGLNGAFVGSAFGYPLGAPRHWTLSAVSGDGVGMFGWADLGSRPLVSPDGSRVVYIARAPDGHGSLMVRDVVGGTTRGVASLDRAPYAWLDDQHVLVDARGGAIQSIDMRDGSEATAFAPIAPLPPNPAGPEADFWALSGDLRWAILTRADAQGNTTDQLLYDTRDRRMVASLGVERWSLSPRGDIAVSFDGGRIRVMHLCDRRIVELGARAGTETIAGASWSGDGRYFAVAFGRTTAETDTGPESLVIVEPLAGRVGIVTAPWGYVYAWSPDLRYVALGRRGYHDLEGRLARLEIDGR